MLDKPFDGVVLDDDGAVCGVTSNGETAKCKMVVGDPTYFSDRVKKTGQVVRAICLLNHTIPNTSNANSVQIIFPQSQTGRKSGMNV